MLEILLVARLGAQVPKISQEERYGRLRHVLDQTVLTPSAWHDACDHIADLVGATGTTIIPYDKSERGMTQLHSDSVTELLSNYFSLGWQERDFRALGMPKAIRTGSVTDQDMIAPEEMDKHPYYAELILPAGVKWFAAVPFHVDNKPWFISVNGTAARGPFMAGDIAALKKVAGVVEPAARRVAALGVQRVELMEKTLSSAGRGIAGLGWSGKIAWMNEQAEALLRDADLIRKERFFSSDPRVNRKLVDSVGSAISHRSFSDVAAAGLVAVSLPDGRQISLDAIPMPREFRSLLSGISALMVIREVAGTVRDYAELGMRFGLTGREAVLAAHLAVGRSPAAAANLMGISVSTARQYLKSVLSKSGAHRQAELVAMLNNIDT